MQIISKTGNKFYLCCPDCGACFLNIVVQRLKHHIHYFFRARHRRGRGIHAPFAYHLIADIIEEKHPYYCYEELEALRAELQRTQTEGQNALSCRNCLHPAEAQLLFRLVQAFALRSVMEWGGIDDITRLYLQRSSSELIIYSEGQAAPEFPDLLFCNANLEEHALSRALQQALQHKTEQSMLVLAGPHRSAGAYRCWQQVLMHPDLRLAVEMKRLGLAFFNPELQKGHLVLRR